MSRTAAIIRRISGFACGVMVMLIRLYQLTLSPYIGRQCRFMPTCSNYFIEALRKKGLVRGTLMGIWRLLRCNPFCKGGYDPVK